MDYSTFFANLDLSAIGFVSLATFGAVSAVNFWRKQDRQVNFLLSVVFAIVFSFVPADMGNIIVNKVRDGVAIALTVNGLYQGLSGIALKASGTQKA